MRRLRRIGVDVAAESGASHVTPLNALNKILAAAPFLLILMYFGTGFKSKLVLIVGPLTGFKCEDDFVWIIQMNVIDEHPALMCP